MMKKGRRLYRKAVYASPERRALLWKKVIALVTQKRKPTAAQVKSVLPAQLYNEYVRRTTIFQLTHEFDAVPEFISSYMKQRQSLRKQYGNATRLKKNDSEFKKIVDSYVRVMEAFNQKLDETGLKKWMRTAHGDDIAGHLLEYDDLATEDSIKVRSVREMNTIYSPFFPDCAEREALQSYLIALEIEFGQTGSWKEIVDDLKHSQSQANWRGVNRIRANYTFDLLSSLALITKTSAKQGLKGFAISTRGNEIVFGRVD